MQPQLNLGLYLQRFGTVILTAILLAGCSDDTDEPQSGVTIKESNPGVFELLNPQLSEFTKEISLDYVRQIGIDFKKVAIEIDKLQLSIITLINQTNSKNLSLMAS